MNVRHPRSGLRRFSSPKGAKDAFENELAAMPFFIKEARTRRG
jgi:hypothetical protein